jgi:hypothetical protein
MSTTETCGNCEYCRDRNKYPDCKAIMDAILKDVKLCDSTKNHPFVKTPFIVYENMPACGSFKRREKEVEENGF